MKKTFYSNGKLLITAEYLVLDGALALALPTKLGQDLVVESTTDGNITWKSYDNDNSLWYDEVILLDSIRNNNISSDNEISKTLVKILHEAYLLNPDVFTTATGFNVCTNLSFPRIWGLGTSSTLINNIAQWFQIDAFVLLQNSFGGSGYDIACAQHNTPILYQRVNGKASVSKTDFNPPFASSLYFVYLNKKQNSKDAIAAYRSKKSSLLASKILEINSITNEIISATDVKTFSVALQQHENVLAEILEMKTVGESLFPDFHGVVKSLGGWGGDFILAISHQDPTAYFQSKGYSTTIPYQEMVL